MPLADANDYLCRRLRSLSNSEDGVFSQYSEDGVLIALLDILGIDEKRKFFVEFGVESGIQCNTRILRERVGFEGLSMDGGYENATIDLHKEFVTEGNILHLLEKHGVPANFDILSIDVDMFDLWILAKILRSEIYKPRVIVVETNPTLCVNDFMADYKKANSLPLVVTHPDKTNQTMWDSTRYSGGNPRAFQALGVRFGYDMVHCERCGVNCFLVQREALPEMCREDFVNNVPMVPYPCFATLTPEGGTRVGHPPDDKERPVILLEDSLLDVTTQTAHDNEDLFSGIHHVDASRNGYACGRGTPSSPRGWGGDWCLFAYSYPETQASNEIMRAAYGSAFMAFSERQFDVSFGAFSSFLNESLVDSAFGPCVSHHASEAGCYARARSSFNAAISALNMAADLRTEQQQQEMLGKAMYYIDLSLTYDQTDDHIQGMRQLLTFLSLGSQGIADLIHKKTTLSIHITRKGEDTTSLDLDVSLCDDLALLTQAFCTEHALGPDQCGRVLSTLEQELEGRLFPYPLVPFNFLERQPPRGFVEEPSCLGHFGAVRGLAALDCSASKEEL